MRIGAVFPQMEIGNDPAVIRHWAEAVEDMGYRHVLAFDHVLGAGLDTRPGWGARYSSDTAFHEVFVLFGYLAAVTSALELVTGVLVLPQRQTALVAKQAAEVDVLSGGRMRLGVGVGWNDVEFEALGETFTNRGRRTDEQIEVLRALWTTEHVEVHGQWHSIPDAGISPLPVQQPVPLWFGGHSEPAIRRMARVGDGWMPLYGSASEARPGLALLDECLAEAGRSRAGFGLEARIPFGTGDHGQWRRLLDEWSEVGATHASLVTTDHGLRSSTDHLAALERFAPVAQEYLTV